jgi:hypothetical protein
VAKQQQAAKKTQFKQRVAGKLAKVKPIKKTKRGIIKNPRRDALRKKARIGGSTQFVIPTLGVS